jgi:large subunit ribosomal protein L21
VTKPVFGQQLRLTSGLPSNKLHVLLQAVLPYFIENQAVIMFAVIRTGGKQYKVAKDDVIEVEKLAGEPGAKVEIGDVLMAGGKVGSPLLSGVKVLAEIVKQFRDDKVIIFKKRRRHNYRRKKGHRQYLTQIKITDIKA